MRFCVRRTRVSTRRAQPPPPAGARRSALRATSNSLHVRGLVQAVPGSASTPAGHMVAGQQAVERICGAGRPTRPIAYPISGDIGPKPLSDLGGSAVLLAVDPDHPSTVMVILMLARLPPLQAPTVSKGTKHALARAFAAAVCTGYATDRSAGLHRRDARASRHLVDATDIDGVNQPTSRPASPSNDLGSSGGARS